MLTAQLEVKLKSLGDLTFFTHEFLPLLNTTLFWKIQYYFDFLKISPCWQKNNKTTYAQQGTGSIFHLKGSYHIF